MTTSLSISTRIITRCFSAALVVVAITGCPDEDAKPSPGGTEGDPSICAVCPNEAAFCECENEDRQGCISESVCIEYCADQDDDFVSWGRVSCQQADPVGSCAGWSPASKITYVTATQTYEIDQAWAASVAYDLGSAPLWTCDNAGFAAIAGGFKVINANSGEFLYQIGLRNNDEVQAINGVNVKTWAGAEAAFRQYLGGATQYLAVVKRGTNNITLKWKLVP